MNKLSVRVIDILESIDTLEVPLGDSELHFKRDEIIKELIIPKEFNTVWYLDDGKGLDIQCVIDTSSVNGSIKIISSLNNNLLFHLGISNEGDSRIDLINQVVGDNNNSEIQVRVVSKSDCKFFLKATGYLIDNTHNNTYLEDIKYLNEYPSSITCLPELIVLSDDVSASHNMTVGSISEEELFYLESRGISSDKAREMIRNSFLLSMKRREVSDE